MQHIHAYIHFISDKVYCISGDRWRETDRQTERQTFWNLAGQITFLGKAICVQWRIFPPDLKIIWPAILELWAQAGRTDRHSDDWCQAIMWPYREGRILLYLSNALWWFFVSSLPLGCYSECAVLVSSGRINKSINIIIMFHTARVNYMCRVFAFCVCLSVSVCLSICLSAK